MVLLQIRSITISQLEFNNNLAMKLRSPIRIDWGDEGLTNDTILYSHWEYISTNMGGVNNLGAGIPMFSLSVGWNASLSSEFMKKAMANLTDIDNVCTKREVTITGYVSFIENTDRNSPEQSGFLNYEMDGSIWLAAIVCADRVHDESQLQVNPWAVVFFRKDQITIPIEVWKSVSKPINIFGEIMGFSPRLPFGSKPCFMKAHGAAFIISTSIV